MGVYKKVFAEKRYNCLFCISPDDRFSIKVSYHEFAFLLKNNQSHVEE